MKRTTNPSLLLAIFTLLSSGPSFAAPDAQAILQRSDHARGGGLPGIVWEIQLTPREGARQMETQHLEVRAAVDASIAETLEPARFRGSKILQVGRNMWLTKPGLSKPVPVSPRQRLTGQASNGDIAATNYAADYTATLAGESVVANESCYILDLKARHNRTTYDQIRYWVTKDREVALKAEFYSLSGKLLKTATFEYGLEISYHGRNIPFISHMLIRDALTDADTDMRYSNVRVRAIAPSAFELGQLQ
jgi:hypothetical protein